MLVMFSPLRNRVKGVRRRTLLTMKLAMRVMILMAAQYDFLLWMMMNHSHYGFDAPIVIDSVMFVSMEWLYWV